RIRFRAPITNMDSLSNCRSQCNLNSHSCFDMGILFRLSKFGNPPKPAFLEIGNKLKSGCFESRKLTAYGQVIMGSASLQIECRGCLLAYLPCGLPAEQHHLYIS